MKYLIIAVSLLFIGCGESKECKGDDVTIGRVIKSNVVSTTGIVEEVAGYDNTQKSFKKLDEVVDGKYVYKRAGDYLSIPNFVPTSTTYKLNDVVYKDGKVNYVTENIIGTVALQPESYATVDTDIKPSLWGNRYALIGTFINDNILINKDNYRYEFSRNGASVTTRIIKKDVDGDVTYVKSANVCKYLRTEDNQDARAIIYLSKCDHYYILDNVNTATFVINEVYTANNGAFKVKGIEQKAISSVGNGDATDYSFVLLADQIVHESTKTALSTSNINTPETKAVRVNDYEFVPHTYIIRGDKLYLRTSVDAVQQTRDIAEIETKVLEYVEEIDWGWSKYRPIAPFAPFDSKKSTVLETTNDITFTLTADKMFNELALNNLYASNVRVDILNPDGTLANTVNVVPKCTSIVEGEAVSFPLTMAIYFQNVTAGMSVKVTISTLNGMVKLGEGVLAYKYILGWTDLEFKNSTKDLSPYSEDQWGEVYYKKGVRKRVFTGTATIALGTYDAIGALLYDIAGETVVIDGNDNIENKESNSNTIFTSAMIIGRFQTSDQHTIKEKGRLSDTATYGFTVVEDA